jgi:hypothetical protein
MGKAHAQQAVAGKLLPQIPLQATGLRLLTLDFPLYKTDPEVQAITDLVDMEGYPHAYLASQLQMPCEIYKLITDHCTKETSQQIRQNLEHFSELIANFLITKIAL